MTMWHRISSLVIFAGLAASAAAMGCGPAQTSGPAGRSATAAEFSTAPDAGLPPPVSKKKGLIVPSDTSIGAQPAGKGPHTGTSGGKLDSLVDTPTAPAN